MFMPFKNVCVEMTRSVVQ